MCVKVTLVKVAGVIRERREEMVEVKIEMMPV